jgi:outer membrane receptor protein involved in Fe transport
LRASYVQITNQHFFVNDTTEGNWNKLTVVYDNPNLFEVNGELTWQKHEKLRLVARLDYLGYGMDALSQAWHVPSLRLNLSGKYNLKDKIWITATVIGLNRQFARTFAETAGNVLPVENVERIKGLADVNLGAEYRYNKRLGMFLQLNNILNVRYDRYLYYPTQRFNLLGGISYSF